MRISSIGLIAAVSLGLGGCAYNGVGMGVGTGYGYGDYGYGYGDYGYGYGNDRYAYGYDRYAYGSPYAWYNGYYYPGTGGWVYDRDGRRREIRRDEQAHFGRLTKVFRQRVKERNSVATSPSGATAVTPATRVRTPARTRAIERSERPAARVPRSTSGAARIARALRDSKKD